MTRGLRNRNLDIFAIVKSSCTYEHLGAWYGCVQVRVNAPCSLGRSNATPSLSTICPCIGHSRATHRAEDFAVAMCIRCRQAPSPCNTKPLACDFSLDMQLEDNGTWMRRW